MKLLEFGKLALRFLHSERTSLDSASRASRKWIINLDIELDNEGSNPFAGRLRYSTRIDTSKDVKQEVGPLA